MKRLEKIRDELAKKYCEDETYRYYSFNKGFDACKDILMPEIEKLTIALVQYASGDHINEYGGTNYTPNGECCPHYAMPETVSGEPANYLEGHGDYGFEDGSIAKLALASWKAFISEEEK